MGMCRKVEDAVGQSGGAQPTASLFDSHDRTRAKPVAEVLESFNNLRTKYPAHDRMLNKLISGLVRTDESHIHRRCHVYYTNRVKTPASGAPAPAASAATSQAARPTALCSATRGKGRSVERCCRRAGHGDGVGHDYDKKRRGGYGGLFMG